MTVIVGSSALRSTWRHDHRAPGQALERRRARVVGVERLDHAGARHARDVAEQHQAQRDRGQDQVVDLVADAGAGRRVAAVIGSTFSQMPKTMIRTMPDTNSGTPPAERPPTVMIAVERPADLERRDDAADRCRAARRARRPAPPASSEFSSADVTNGRDRLAVGVASRPGRRAGGRCSQSQYCTSTGRSVPSWWLSASTARWSANGPRIGAADVPGSSWHEEEDHDAQQPERDQRETDAA